MTDTERIIQATHGSPDHPLRMGDIEIPCYVLEDGQRVLYQRALVSALGMARGGSSEGRGDRLAKFAAQKTLQAFVPQHLLEVTSDPIKFRTPSGHIAYGYEATVLADLCEAVLSARSAGKLQKQQEHIAERCEILVRGFARVGIIALVDEATGYQTYRERRALERILEKFISKELARWAKTFPDDFYEELFRLRDWPSPTSVKRPGVVGHWTNDIVYERLAPGVLEELKKITPRDEKGRTKHRFFQRLTNDVGLPELHEHLIAVIALMKASPNWATFYRLLQRAKPKLNEQMPLPIDGDAF